MLRLQIKKYIKLPLLFCAFKRKRVGVSPRLVYTKYNLVASDEFAIKDANTE